MGCRSAPEWLAGGGATEERPTVTSHAKLIPQLGPNIAIYCTLTVLPMSDRQHVEKKRKDYTFRRQFNEKPSMIPGCPQTTCKQATEDKSTAWNHGAQHVCWLEAACL